MQADQGSSPDPSAQRVQILIVRPKLLPALAVPNRSGYVMDPIAGSQGGVERDGLVPLATRSEYRNIRRCTIFRFKAIHQVGHIRNVIDQFDALTRAPHVAPGTRFRLVRRRV